MTLVMYHPELNKIITVPSLHLECWRVVTDMLESHGWIAIGEL
jgi:hypothetical protein